MANYVSHAIKNGKEIYWDIYGSGNDEDKIKNIIQSLELASIVNFKGSTDRNELIKQYELYDVFFLMPCEQESFGLVFVEAASQGLPSLTVNKYGIKEAVKHQETGIFIKDEKSFELALQDVINNREDYAKNSLEYSKLFSSKFMMYEILK